MQYIPKQALHKPPLHDLGRYSQDQVKNLGKVTGLPADAGDRNHRSCSKNWVWTEDRSQSEARRVDQELAQTDTGPGSKTGISIGCSLRSQLASLHPVQGGHTCNVCTHTKRKQQGDARQRVKYVSIHSRTLTAVPYLALKPGSSHPVAQRTGRGSSTALLLPHAPEKLPA